MSREIVQEACLNLRVRRAARAVTRRYDAVLRETGLTSGQFSLLTFVSEDPVPTIGELAEGLGMDRTTVLAALRPLEASGLVRVSPNPADGRGRLIALTEEGRKSLDAALPLWERAQRDSMRRLGQADPRRFNEALEALTD